MKSEITISVKSEALDNAIEKANRLVVLLREVQQIIDSFSGIEKSETHEKNQLSDADVSYLASQATKAAIAAFADHPLSKL